MKKLLLTLITITKVFIHAQVWVPATPFPGASGYINNCTNNNNTFINSLCEFNNELYVGGNFSSIGGIVAHGIARWNGNNWSSVGTGNLVQNGCVGDIVVYNSNLYFTADKLYRWDGVNVQDVTYIDPVTQNILPVYGQDLHVFNGELYVVSDKILKYNGSTFSEIPLDNNLIGSVRCIDNLNNILYVGSTNGLFKYQNSNWIDCNGVTTDIPDVYDIEPFNNELYVLGWFSSIGGISVNNFAKYNGNTWSNIILPGGFYPITPLLSGWTLGRNHLNKMNNELYLAHTLASYQQQSPSYSPLTKFNGSQWILLSQNYSVGGGCSIIYNNELYCGGKFGVFTGGIIIDNFAKLQNSVGLEESYLDKIEISPNPTLNSITIKRDLIKEESFSIFDHLGRVVLNGKLNGISTEVNISALPKGIYTLKIEGNYQPAQIVKE
jgi:hypothetical protein